MLPLATSFADHPSIRYYKIFQRCDDTVKHHDSSWRRDSGGFTRMYSIEAQSEGMQSLQSQKEAPFVEQRSKHKQQNKHAK